MRARTALTAGLIALSAGASTLAAQATDTTKAAPVPTGLVGKWTGSVDGPNGGIAMDATIRKDSTVYSGTVGSPQGELALYDVKVVGDTLSAGATMRMEGQGIDLWYTFVLKGDTITGSVAASFGGQSMSYPLVLKRVPAK